MFKDLSEIDRNKISDALNKIVNNTYKKNVILDSQARNSGGLNVDEQFVVMQDILRYYDRKSNSKGFQEQVLDGIKRGVSFESILNELEHDINDDKQRDEGIDKTIEEAEEEVNRQIIKGKLPSKQIDKEEIIKELEQMAENEDGITQNDIKNFVKAATIKAIYKATLEKYEQNRREIEKHTDIMRQKYGDYAYEDRLATENLQYEVYLQKLAKQYKSVDPKHRTILEDKEINEKKQKMNDEHNKKEKLNEERKKEEIDRIRLLYAKKQEIQKEMSQMSANPTTFDKEKYDKLRADLYDVTRQLSMVKTAPDVLIENIEREERQENREIKQVGENPIKKTISNDNLNEAIEDENNKTIIKEVSESQKKDSHDLAELIKKYREYRNEGKDYEAIQTYEIIETTYGSKEILDKNMEETNNGKEGVKDYQTQGEKENSVRNDMGLNEVNDDAKIGSMDEMDLRVEQIAKEKRVDIKDYNASRESVENNTSVPQHTLYNSKKH